MGRLEMMQDWELVMGWTDEMMGWVDEPEPAVVCNNKCYICGRLFQDTQVSEICSQECLDFEAVADVCAYQKCRKLYIIDAVEPSFYCSKYCQDESIKDLRSSSAG